MTSLVAPRPATMCAITRLVVMIPAHNECLVLGAALASVMSQTGADDVVLVIADNCSDNTAEIARSAGADVFVTHGNTYKKAGALNQALEHLLPLVQDDCAICVMDADSSLAHDFIRTALATLNSALVPRQRRRKSRQVSSAEQIAAVGGIFFGHPGGGLVGQFQRNEYLRYARQVQASGKVWVLTGTGSMFRAGALRDVLRARIAGELPGEPSVYDILSLTEDNELTLALKSLGYKVASPTGCRVDTEIMPTWTKLWHQRLRWQRGALENLRHYGWNPTTKPYFFQQGLSLLGVAFFSLYLLTTSMNLLTLHKVNFQGFWLGVTCFFIVERVVTVRRGGLRAMLIAAPLVSELAYSFFLQIVLLKAVVDVLRRADAQWGQN